MRHAAARLGDFQCPPALTASVGAHGPSAREGVALARDAPSPAHVTCRQERRQWLAHENPQALAAPGDHAATGAFVVLRPSPSPACGRGGRVRVFACRQGFWFLMRTPRKCLRHSHPRGQAKWRSHSCLSGRQSPEMTGPFDKADHLGCPIDCQRVAREARPRRDVSRHVANKLELTIRRLSQECDQHVLQRDHADLKLYQFGVRQRRNIGLHRTSDGALWLAVEPGPAFALRPRKGSFELTLVRKVHETRPTFKHEEAPRLLQLRP